MLSGEAAVTAGRTGEGMVAGDVVNTASRLQEAAREIPHDVIIGHGTASRARRHALTLLGEKVLRGKEKPTILYTLTAAMQPRTAQAGEVPA